MFLCSELLFTGACGGEQKLEVKNYKACQSIAGEPADLPLSVCQLFPVALGSILQASGQAVKFLPEEAAAGQV